MVNLFVNVVPDGSVLGRTVAYGENYNDAIKNAAKHRLQELKKGANTIMDRTSFGRMYKYDESFGEAWLNAGKESLKDLNKLTKTYKSISKTVYENTVDFIKDIVEK